MSLTPKKIRSELANTIRKGYRDLQQLVAAYEALGGDSDTLGVSLPKETDEEEIDVPDVIAAELTASGKARRTGFFVRWLYSEHSVDVTPEWINEVLSAEDRFQRGAKGWWSLREQEDESS